MKKGFKTAVLAIIAILSVFSKYLCLSAINLFGRIPEGFGFEYESYFFNAVLFVLVFELVDNKLRKSWMKFVNVAVTSVVYTLTLLYENCFYQYLTFNNTIGWDDPVSYKSIVSSAVNRYSTYGTPEYHWPVFIIIVACSLIAVYHYYRAELQSYFAGELLGIAKDADNRFAYDLLFDIAPYGLTLKEYADAKDRYMSLLCHESSLKCMKRFGDLDDFYVKGNKKVKEEYAFEYADNSAVTAPVEKSEAKAEENN